MLIDQLSKSLVKLQDKEDELTRIELESRIELILMQVKKLDTYMLTILLKFHLQESHLFII